ncbi:methyltransferase [Oscillospiraceae bacterium CM]|nr:methyltransferase [Oscillospiraceae bacterium CM]
MTDAMWPGGPVFKKSEDAFRIGTDAVLLAAFAGDGQARRVCDLGCGSGVLAILLAYSRDDVRVDGIELLPVSAAIARENVRLNGLGGQIDILNRDLREHRDFLTAGAYDLVVANPPYYVTGSGQSSRDAATAAARAEHACTLHDVCAAAAFLTRWGGRFALVHKPERLADVITTLRQTGFEPKRLRFVHYKAVAAPNLFLIDSRRGGKPSLVIEPPLILTDENGYDTDEIKKIYHRDARGDL